MKSIRYFVMIQVLTFSAYTHAGVMLQAFHWDAQPTNASSWWMQLASQTQELSQAGFTAVWIPPALKGASGGYSRGYDPYDDYDLGSKDQRGTVATHWGSRFELQRMVAQARANGLQVLLDLNISHRVGDGGDKKFFYKDSFGQEGRGRFQKGPLDFGEDFPFGRHFNFYSPYVRSELKQAGEWMVKSLGTQGFRIDAAKHMPAEFVKDYLNHGELKNQYAVVEHWDSADVLYDYVRRGLDSRAAAFDFPLWSNLREMSLGGGFYDLRRLVKSGFVGLAPELSVTFVENHDTDRDHATTKNKHLGYAYILTSEGYPCVFWRDYFDYGMKSLLQNLIWIHEALAQGPTEYRWADQDLLVYERTGQPGVLVGINDSSWESRSEWVQTHFAPNTELHDYSGKQHSIWTDYQGRVKITVPPNEFVAFSRAGIQFEFPSMNFRTTQEFAGAEDLDIKPALNNQFNAIGYIYVQGGTPLDWELTYDRSGWNQSSKFEMQILDSNNQVVAKNQYDSSIGLARGSSLATTTGWYRLEVSAINAPAPVRFWWKQTYQAPQH